MEQVNIQNLTNKNGIQQYRYRYWPESQWQESESLTVGRPFYNKSGQPGHSWKKPQELIDNDNFEEIYKDYTWKTQCHFLKNDKIDYVNNPDRHEMKCEPFKVHTNTFPIELSKNVNVLEYQMIVTPIELQDDWGFKKQGPNKRSFNVIKYFKQYVAFIFFFSFLYSLFVSIFSPRLF